ncbi:MAG: hypothetical protein AAEJ57_05865, partial [Opitutales bacterium]
MESWLRALIIAFGGLALSSCIEFEREEIQYRHDASADQLRVTLKYVGIFGGKGSSWSNNEAQEEEDPKKLTSEQIEQFESILKGGRAFFFENWIFEYDRSSIQKTLKKLQDGKLEPGDLTVGEPEKKFLQVSLEDIELTNLGFCLDENKLLCGTQTLTINEFSNYLAVTNEMIRRQVVHGIEQQLSKVESGKFKPEDAPSAETSALLINACKEKHDFLLVKKGRLVVRVPLGKREYREFKKEILDKKPKPDNPENMGLPSGFKVTYRNQMLTLVLGNGKHGIASLTKKCHPGYSDN